MKWKLRAQHWKFQLLVMDKQEKPLEETESVPRRVDRRKLHTHDQKMRNITGDACNLEI